MKQAVQLLCILGLTALLHLPAAAASTYTDDCDSLAADNVRSYKNLVINQEPESRMADPTSLTLPSHNALGEATYRIAGAQTVEVAVYSKWGTFLTPYASGYSLGVNYIYPSAPAVSGLRQALYSPSEGTVYAQINGDAYQLGSPLFVAADALPSDCIGYGVHVLASADGQRYTAVPLSYVGVTSHSSTLAYEVHRATLPAGATHIKVVVNDFSHLLQGAATASNLKAPTMLASVTFQGSSLQLGDTDPGGGNGGGDEGGKDEGGDNAGEENPDGGGNAGPGENGSQPVTAPASGSRFRPSSGSTSQRSYNTVAFLPGERLPSEETDPVSAFSHGANSAPDHHSPFAPAAFVSPDGDGTTPLLTVTPGQGAPPSPTAAGDEQPTEEEGAAGAEPAIQFLEPAGVGQRSTRLYKAATAVYMAAVTTLLVLVVVLRRRVTDL